VFVISVTWEDYSGGLYSPSLVYEQPVSCPKALLTANAGGPYTATRMQLTTLDASRSTLGANPITNCRWSWTPGANCNGIPLASAGENGKTVTIEPLCDLNITLTVTDSSGATSTDTTTLTGSPRGGEFATTPSTYQADGNLTPPTPFGPPTAEDGFLAGANVGACSDGVGFDSY
jgi:hypothetical protein